jgi:glutamine---fructose-6-phosphate transaminase (isomerizing)
MDAAAFLADLEAKPETLTALADAIDEGALDWPLPAGLERIVLTGMGSSWFAARVAALRLRRLGVMAVAERASVDETLPPDPTTLLVAISASGGSAETSRRVERHAGGPTIALTNVAGSAMAAACDAELPLLAGPEAGGVACRSFQHTLVALLRLEEQLGAEAVRRCADASADLLDRRPSWLPEAAEHLGGPDGTWLIAPAERIASALQGALMLREGPRRAADGCETGDWSHVDVYLTKTLDYRCIVFTGSRWDGEADDWLTQRASTVVAVGAAPVASAAMVVRHHSDDDPLVATLTEVLVPELLAAHWWLAA